MKAGLIGLPASGRDTVFRALTGLGPAPGLNEQRQGEALVEDPRLDWLSSVFKPKKHTPARVELSLSRPQGQNPAESLKLSLERVRDADVLLLILRNFETPGLPPPDPAREAREIGSELLVTDYVTVERRLERMAEERKKGKRGDPAEQELLEQAKSLLEDGRPLREERRIAAAPQLRGFGLLSAKPALLVVNSPDEADDSFRIDGAALPQLALRGALEAEISRLDPAEAREFLADYGLAEPGRARVLKTVYSMMELISFFTVGEDECRAWTVTSGEDALAAAGKIHSDIRKGFIRAEVVAYDDFRACGGFSEAKKRGLFRLEGKTYRVADGDVVHFRFNV
jgi:ribosome-binding ATPase YchF (GTP1/OBG family)